MTARSRRRAGAPPERKEKGHGVEPTPLPDDGREIVAPANRAAFRAWLAANHARSDSIWLVHDKDARRRGGLTYAEAVEEALCFGWIDSVVRRRDARHYLQLFSPRKRRSAWSKINKARVERLATEGRMAPPGLAKVEAAKVDGSWTLLDGVEQLVIPPELGRALGARPVARRHFEAFPASVKKALFYWVVSAKRPETREKRIATIVDKAAENVRAMFDRPAKR